MDLNNPPKTGDARLDSFLVAVHQALNQLNRTTKPAEGWSLTDFTAQVSEVIGDKRDLIDIVTSLDGSTQQVEAWVEEMRGVVALVAEGAPAFSQVMEWWDQNYKIIADAQESLTYKREAEGFAEDSERFSRTSLQHREGAKEERLLAEGALSDAQKAASDAHTYRQGALTYREGSKEHREASEAAKGFAEAAQALSEQFRDSAKAHREAAKTSETNAASSASKAKTSETNAKASETAAKTSETNAATSETQAAGSVEAAADSESAAAESASDAHTYQAGALTYQEGSKEHRTAAEAARTGAETARDRSEDYRDGAKAHREAAKVSETNAEASASAASTDANKSAGSATEAAGEVTKAEAAREQVEAIETALRALMADTKAWQDVTSALNQVDTEIAAAMDQVKEDILGGVGPAFDTLLELAEALGDNADAIGTLTNELAKKAEKGHTHVSADIRDTAYSSNGAENGGQIVKFRDSDGHIYMTVDPTDHRHLTRKGWVDEQIGKKANTSHTHTISETSGLQTALDGKAPESHIHSMSDVDGLDAALAARSADGHKHDQSDITGTTWTIGHENSGGQVVKTNGDGWIYSYYDPISDNHLVRKIYVDDKVKEIVSIGEGEDLNDYRTTGTFIQQKTADASSGTNYPVGQAGLLRVNDDGGAFTFQEYTTLRGEAKYFRGRYSDRWGEWQRVAEKAEVDSELDKKANTGHTHVSADITDAVDHIHGGRAGRLVEVGEHGHIRDGNPPTNQYDLTNKGYVDQEVGKKADTGHKHEWSDINAEIKPGASIVPLAADSNVQSWTVGIMEEVIDEEAPTGRYYSTTGGTQGFPIHRFQVDEDLPYYFSLYVKADRPGSRIYLEVGNGDTNLALTGSPYGNGYYLLGNYEMPTEWTKLEGVVRFREGTRVAAIYKGYFNHPNGSTREATQMLTDIQFMPIPKHGHVSADITDATDFANAGTIPIRNSGGRFNVGEPVAQGNATTKGYVDSEVAKKANSSHSHSWSQITSKPSTFKPSSHTHDVSDISKTTDVLHANYPGWNLKTRDDGQLYIYTDTITSPNHAANKSYVDSRPATWIHEGGAFTLDPKAAEGDVVIDLSTGSVHKIINGGI